MKVFYSEKMAADSQSFSPSASKPRLAVQSWLDAGYPIEIVAPDPVDCATLSLAHSSAYVEDVLSGVTENGFGNCSMEVAETLPYTTGAMLSAARHVIHAGGFACAPVSGFHHAGFDSGGGFCTFNGLMVTALELLRTGEAAKVGILDFDQHYGDGTDDIIRMLGLDGRVVHRTKGDYPYDAKDFLSWIANGFKSAFSDCDVVLYQAGADPHVDDPLGGWLTTSQMRVRDELVFGTAASMAMPVAWNLAGGYQRDNDGGISPVLALHHNTMKACLSAIDAPLS